MHTAILCLNRLLFHTNADEKFYGEYDDGIMYNDPDLGVEWPFDEIGGIENLIIADKDKNLQTFKEYEDKYLK